MSANEQCLRIPHQSAFALPAAEEQTLNNIRSSQNKDRKNTKAASVQGNLKEGKRWSLTEKRRKSLFSNTCCNIFLR
jgi:hypothetical protein